MTTKTRARRLRIAMVVAALPPIYQRSRIMCGADFRLATKGAPRSSGLGTLNNFIGDSFGAWALAG